MSEDDGQDPADQESQLGAALYTEHWGRGGKPDPDPAYVKKILSDEEREHNANMFGVTYRERVRRDHNRCIILCLAPNAKRVNKCPSCYGKAVPMDIYMAKLDALPGFAQRLGRWIGEWLAALAEAVTLPFRRDREHARALIVDVLQDAMAAGLSADIPELADILTVLESIDKQLAELRNVVDKGE